MPILKNIILDYGNVIIDIDQSRTERAFNYLFPDKSSESLGETFWHSYETGQISTDVFLDKIQSLSKKDVTQKQIVDAWNAMLLSIPAYRLDHLINLSQHYRLFLLSNTNALHIQWTTRYLNAMHGIINFEKDFFETAYYSHQVHLRKPDKEIFEFVLSDSRINPSETIFIDDTAGHLLNASSLGIYTHCLQRGEEFYEIVKNFTSE